MTPSPATPDHPSPSERRHWLVGAAGFAGLSLFVVVTLLLLAKGCKRPPSPVADEKGATIQKTDPWLTAARKLAKDTDFSTCQSVLRTLNDNLRIDDAAQKPTAITDEWEKAIAPVPLSPEDREEIHNWAFSSHDAAYLAECLYLRDVAQSVRLLNLTDEQLADIAFAWVCRAASLAEAPLGADARLGFVLTDGDAKRPHVIAAALPPVYVLRRGSGTGLERMYVFLALLQQLELDGCLIGPPSAGPVGSAAAVDDAGRPIPGGPARPFWGVGVRTGSDIRVYDPWRGEAFPAPLNSLKRNPEPHATWFESPANTTRLKPTDLKDATVYLALPVNSLSVRMDLLNQRLKDVGVRLAYNPAALRDAFPDPKPVFWNPPGDRFAYGRAARTFLPRELGGNPMEPRLYDPYKMSQMPVGVDVALPEFRDPDMAVADERLKVMTWGLYLQSFVEPPNPRERIQRGQFQDAVRDLIEKQDRFAKSLELLHNTPEADERIQAWAKLASRVYGSLGAGKLLTDPAARQAADAESRYALDSLWREPGLQLLINRVAVPLCQAETVYELCLCKHEMAERAQVRADHAAEDAPIMKKQARDAWKEARLQWQTYEGYADQQGRVPGRLEQARTLKSRAEKYAGEAK